MTEAEWTSCREPEKMLTFLRESGRVSERKLRLFGVAVCRRIWPLLADVRSRRAVEVAEREADGFSTAAALREVEQDAKAAIPSLSLGFRPSEQAAAAGAMAAARVDAARAAGLACGWGRNVSLALAYENDASDLSGTKAKALADWDVQAVTLLRCISGDRLGATPVIEPAWATATVVMLAQAAYEHRSLPTGHLDPDRLAALADAVEAAGCTDAELLGHLRSPGPHVRGWFALELLLGRE